MGPLDLTKQKPRGPRVKLAGLVFMARTVDKLRAELPGGAMGDYLNRPDGLSAYLCARVGINLEELRAVVATAPNEAAVETWLRTHLDLLDPARLDEANLKLETANIERMPPDFAETFRKRHPVMESRPELVRFFDIIEADEALV